MMQSISLSQLAKQTSGDLIGPDAEFSSISIDSRTVAPSDLFIAIKGDRFDGHEFIETVEKSGCSLFVVSSDSEKMKKKLSRVSYLRVENTLLALGECGRINRENFQGKVVGLTGSTGKTSTKNMLEAILSEKGATCATQGNFNNEIGVPLTLLKINTSHQYAVVEMGARKIGDIAYLTQLVQPDVSILLNAGTAHIDIFGSQENIVKGKGEIFGALRPNGHAVVNLDDPAHLVWLEALQEKSVFSFSLTNKKADVFASEIVCQEQFTTYILNYGGSKQEIRLPIPGEHNVANSLAAAAAALALGFDIKMIAKGLAGLAQSEGRLMTIPCSESLELIDDSYNANPTSMKAAIDVLSLKNGCKIAVLGEMGELGDFAQKLHIDVARHIANSHVDTVYLIGPYASDMKKEIGERAVVASSKQEILEYLDKNDDIFSTNSRPLSEISVLVKGSRSTAMDELVNMIIKKAAH
ncbi:MAG: UDP-N-acetylmuramoyl-tripeptide--D-alanyl-D-alanine ligase [Oleiphilus sp.]